MNDTSIVLLALVLAIGIAVSIILNGWKGLLLACALLFVTVIVTGVGRFLGHGFELTIACGILIAALCWSYIDWRKKASPQGRGIPKKRRQR